MAGRHRAADRGLPNNEVLDPAVVRVRTNDNYTPRHLAPEDSDNVLFTVIPGGDQRVE